MATERLSFAAGVVLGLTLTSVGVAVTFGLDSGDGPRPLRESDAQMLLELRRAIDTLRTETAAALDHNGELNGELKPVERRPAENMTHVDDLVERLQDIIDRNSTLVTLGSPVGLIARVEKQPVAITQLLSETKGDWAALRTRHFAWPATEVYQRYGLPDEAYTASSLVFWDYKLADGRLLRFQFAEGMVHNVQVSSE